MIRFGRNGAMAPRNAPRFDDSVGQAVKPMQSQAMVKPMPTGRYDDASSSFDSVSQKPQNFAADVAPGGGMPSTSWMTKPRPMVSEPFGGMKPPGGMIGGPPTPDSVMRQMMGEQQGQPPGFQQMAELFGRGNPGMPSMPFTGRQLPMQQQQEFKPPSYGPVLPNLR
jgi:hypothetical protein